MGIFEIYPPSSVLISVGVIAGMLIGGLEFVIYFLAGAAITALGHHLDWYGVRRDK